METGKSGSDPGPSHESDQIEEDSIHREVLKQQLKDALVYFESLLRNSNLIEAEPSSSLNEETMVIGEEMFQNTLEMLAEKSLVLDEELTDINEIDDSSAYEEVETSLIANESSDEYEPDEKKKKRCQYQSTFNRPLTEKGSKAVLVNRHDINKVTHSYTAQYSITMSGRVLPPVFVCLQETTGTFGPRVQKTVNEYAKKYSNVVITSSKSGKLTTGLYKDFLRNALKPYVQNEKFLLLIDSWGGQTNPELYDEMFQDDKKLPTCTMKIIPPKCTPLVQPCDIYFYRQVKNLIKRLQNCAFLIERDREINSTENCIKIQSIVHHMLSFPIFSDMIRFAWFTSNLTNDRKFFFNVNKVCFPTDTLRNKYSCKNASFIRCTRCRAVLCFPCFHDNYHSGSCDIPATSCH
ncbi:uncharacterized protein LOC124416409 [Diprion similis]|uniref:uncharacterized protein LOC124416409 n=1 Tax=Diprion similis TaxID=362088 RepID=UPI001EF7B927|nr:uncharacterized protein LOC124416409 [Diprion similis]